MKEELKKLLKNSYSPYSKFKVAAIVVMKDNKTFSGVNVENASYGATICAERAAILAAIASGYTKGDFLGLNIMVDSKKNAPPCFMCRQVIYEFFDTDSIVNMFNNEGEVASLRVSDLCMYPFGEDNL